MIKDYLFTSESVTEGHPDKMCDCISDAILDAYIEKDPYSKVACETAVTTGIVHIMGEISSNAAVDIPGIVRNTVKEIGYRDHRFGFDCETCAVVLSIDKQSEDIARGVYRSAELYKKWEEDGSLYKAVGAGDQGMMFGFACSDTDEYMPAPIYFSHKLCERLSYVRKIGALRYLGPDGKSMVTVRYEGGAPVHIDTVVVSAQHLPDQPQTEIQKDLMQLVIKPVLPESLFDKNTKILINPTGRFVKGGPCADTGLTGRKIIVDTYGGMGRHGGGAFSGKDPTKVDRTGAYAARYVAKNIVAAKLASVCEVQIAYAIGVSEPVSVQVDTFGSGEIEDKKMRELICRCFDLRPAALMDRFQLRKPIYRPLASYGHFGRKNLDLPWERLDKVEELLETGKGLR